MANEIDADLARELAEREAPGGLMAQLSLPGASALAVEHEAGALLILRDIVDAAVAGVVNATLHWIAELYEGRRIHIEREGAFIVELAHRSGALGALALIGAILTRAAGDATSGYQVLGRVSAELREPFELEVGELASGPIVDLTALTAQRGRGDRLGHDGVLLWLFDGVPEADATLAEEESVSAARDDDAGENPAITDALHARLRALERDVEASMQEQRFATGAGEGAALRSPGGEADHVRVLGAVEPSPADVSIAESTPVPESGQPEDGEEPAVDEMLPEADEPGRWALEVKARDERQRELIALLRSQGVAASEGEPVVVQALDAELARSLVRVLRLAGAQPVLRRM